ncbi:MAG TPA: hypothetical protein VIQ30_25015 [Pseudonocardia sp.]
MDKELLFKSRLNEADVEIPDVGTVRVRGLSRVEVLAVRKATDTEQMDGPRALVLERKMLAAAMVDPELSEAEVGQWQQASVAGELEPVVRKVQELSGMLDDAPKVAVKTFRGGSDGGV